MHKNENTWFPLVRSFQVSCESNNPTKEGIIKPEIRMIRGDLL